MERATGTEVYGCGSPQSTDITLNIQTTTGGNFSISLNGKTTVEHLKKVVSKKLKVSKDRICLLHRERQLTDGTLDENGLLDGSRVILLPSVETGLLSQRPENSVMQALESLNDNQVNDFLSGKSPLNLTMRLGDHMMLIQLQLSTLNPARSLKTSTPAKGSTTPRTKSDTRETPSPHSTPNKATCKDKNTVDSDKPKPQTILQKQDLEKLKNAFELYKSMTEEKNAEKPEPGGGKEDAIDVSSSTISDTSETSIESEQSPIKSLSNLVSSPIASTSENMDVSSINHAKSNLIELLTNDNVNSDVIPSTSAMSDKPCPSSTSLATDSSLSDDSDHFTDQSSFLTESTIDEYPMENLFNSAVDKGLFEDRDETMMDREISNLATTSHGQESTAGTLPPFQSINEPLKNKRFQYLLHKTSKFKHPIGQSKQKAFMQSVVNKHKKRMAIRQESNLAMPSTSKTEPYITNTRKLVLQPSSSSNQTEDFAVPSTSTQSVEAAAAAKKAPILDTKTLIEASKNLTQKLKRLSKDVLTNKIDLRTAEEAVRSNLGPGAVIESMRHHGKGVYSGTFSGTLNPALQDRYGRPKRDISTIIHILNDLLCASPPFQQEKLQEQTSKCSGCGHLCCSGQCVDPARACACGGQRGPACACRQACACGGQRGPACACRQACACGGQAGPACACRLAPAAPAPAAPLCAACQGSPAGIVCADCTTARTLAQENTKTKCKLEQLRLVMQQKKQRREARKLKTLPYNSPQKTINSPDTTNTIQEEIETVA